MMESLRINTISTYEGFHCSPSFPFHRLLLFPFPNQYVPVKKKKKIYEFIRTKNIKRHAPCTLDYLIRRDFRADKFFSRS